MPLIEGQWEFIVYPFTFRRRTIKVERGLDVDKLSISIVLVFHQASGVWEESLSEMP